MVRKLFKCLSLLMILSLSIFGTAAAASKSRAEITNIDAYDINENILRLEITLNGALNKEDISTNISGNIFSISLENTTPGRISRISGTKIKDTTFVKKIAVKEMEMNHTRVRLTLTGQINEKGYKFSIQPSKTDKKSSRLVVDVLKNKAIAWDDEDENDDWLEDISPDSPEVVAETKSKDDKKSKNKDKDKFKSSDKVVVIDAGHGGSDTGAVGPRGTTEKAVALAVALKTEKILQDEGFKVVMTRRTDIDVAAPNASNTAELQARVNKAPSQADIFISIHCNAFSNPKSNGMETYYYGSSAKAQKLAKLMNEELAKYGGLFNRGVKVANFYVLKHTKCPATLIEIGFITNPDEEKLLASEKYQNKLAGAIASAVKKYFMN